MKIHFVSFLIVVILGSYHNVAAQDTSYDNGSPKINFLELNVSFTKASGFFKRNYPSVKLGFEMGYLRQLKAEKPLFWGISFYYTHLDNVKATISELLDFSFVDFDYSTTSSLLGLNGKLRFYPNINLGKFESYLEAQLGYKWIYTATTKTIVDDEDSSDFAIEKGSLSLTYGIAAGLNYAIKDNIYINLRANYLPGLSTAYYVKDDQNNVEFSTIDKYDLKNSTTDIIRWDLGVTFWPSFSNEE
ncbi:MAG: outer membrane beta-barrel protein [Saprospiraceae bacterium]|nr:outer membrane beta-barrel protein [Saprospiraceae bacterium]